MKRDNRIIFSDIIALELSVVLKKIVVGKNWGEPRVKRAVSQRSSVFAEPSSNFFESVHTFGFRERSGGRRQSATPSFDRIKAQIGGERKAER